MSIKYCKTCIAKGTFQDGSIGCAKFKIPIDENKDFCSRHITASNVLNCALCGHLTPSNELFCWINKTETQQYWICENCLSKIGTCTTCKYSQVCEFAQDHSEPQIVMKTVQQGFATIQSQIKNPNLVQKHCATCHCACSNSMEYDCQKDTNGVYCANWINALST